MGSSAEAALVPAFFGVLALAACYNWLAWRRQTRSSGQRAAPAFAEDDPQPGSAAARTPKVSALVAAWNEAETIEQHIQSFRELVYPAKQLVLCAGGDDRTYEVASRFGGSDVVVLRQAPGEGKQRALRRCLDAADGEIVMLTDADCRFVDEAFDRLIGPIARAEAEVTTGYWGPWPEQRTIPFVRFQWFVQAASEGARREVDGVLGFNCAMRREVIEAIGAFDALAPTGTDYVLSRLLVEAGYQIRWVPDSLVDARFPTDTRSYLRSWRRWIKNILVFGPRFGDWPGTTRAIVACGLAVGIVGTPLLTPVLGRVALLGPGAIVAIAAMNRIRRLEVGARAKGSVASWRLVAAAPLFVVLDQVAVLLAIYDVVSRDRRLRW